MTSTLSDAAARRGPSAGRSRSALVVTVVHHPEDSRIRQRQIEALLDSGWRVTYAAPFSGYGLSTPAPTAGHPERGSLRCIDLARSSGRRRMKAWQQARRVLHAEAGDHDVVLVHDPELLLAAAGMDLPHLVWDVHEDPAAALGVKDWMPKSLRRPAAAGWRTMERIAEGRHPLLLAEHAYQQRFRQPHPVVPNAVAVPPGYAPSGGDRVCYLGSVTMSRGCDTMIRVARELRRRTDGQVRLEVIGEAADREARSALQRAAAAGELSWLGFLRSDQAFARLNGALAGLCLLRDLPNFRVSLPTKIVEYCAWGVPVITTPLPLAEELVNGAGVGVVVPWDGVDDVVETVLTLRSDPERQRRMSANGHQLARRDHDWTRLSSGFVDVLDGVAAAGTRAGGRA